MGDIEPGGRAPAPGGLGLVQAFINTNDIEDGQEELSDPERLRLWLAAHDLPGGEDELGQDDLRRALEVREALRDLAGANNGEPADPSAAETLNRIASTARLRVRFGTDGEARLEPAERGLTGALALLLANVETAMVDGTWPRFKTCRNDECRWAFYDHSKNRSGTWCTMADCGDKLKARAYRQRRKAGS
jgi:predicted RNA-binding Zn ribbon-like protein